MPILNYTTKIAAEQTLLEISRILTNHGASSITTEFDGAGDAVALTFRIAIDAETVISYRLPANWEAIKALLAGDQKVRSGAKTDAQAKRVAWRIIKDWVEAQMALIEAHLATLDQIFLPYAIADDGRTVYDHWRYYQLAPPPSAAE